MTPVLEKIIRIGLPKKGILKEIFNSDDKSILVLEILKIKLTSEEKAWQ